MPGHSPLIQVEVSLTLRRMRPRHRTIFRPVRTWIGLVATVAWLSQGPTAIAAWNSAPETIENHPTWIYTPDSTPAGGKRGLLVVLHGCGQTNTELKEFGNLAGAADEAGMVVAIPGVGHDAFGPGCWYYDRGVDLSHHAAEITRLAQTLVGRSTLGIDRDAVYVVGLSSGAALSLELGCSAPDVFAGIGAVDGPSVGSAQFSALLDETFIPATNVSDAVQTCEALAGRKSAFFATQVANIAYGDMDRNGPNALYPYLPGDSLHAGQYLLVSVKWSQDNVRVLQRIYGAGALGPETEVQGSAAGERTAAANGQARIALVAVHDVGHAWPAGTGGPDRVGSGGPWMAQKGLDYPRYIAAWLTRNNRRAARSGR